VAAWHIHKHSTRLWLLITRTESDSTDWNLEVLVTRFSYSSTIRWADSIASFALALLVRTPCLDFELHLHQCLGVTSSMTFDLSNAKAFLIAMSNSVHWKSWAPLRVANWPPTTFDPSFVPYAAPARTIDIVPSLFSHITCVWLPF
jgi:hypothetical protein